MELVVLLVVVVAVVALIYYNRSARSLDLNQDGRVDLDDAKVAVTTTVEGVKTDAKKAAVRAKTARKPATKKVAAKKPVAKKSTARPKGSK